MPNLPPAPWTARDDLARLVAALGVDNIRWVGGAVRDTMLGAPVKDVDAATPLLPETVMEKLKEAEIRAVPTGLAHGTVTAAFPQGAVEITTLRRDVATDGRRATVAFADNWREDAARRDFTINALYAHPQTLAISDYFGGLDDLDARRVRFIGAPEERIREDHLRILRYFRFQARFGAALDIAAEEACARLAPTMKGLSRERIAMEVLALLALPDPSATIARMFARGVLTVILPEADAAGVARLQELIASERRQSAAPSAPRRLAALLPPDPKRAEQVAARLRFSGALRKQLVRLAQGIPAHADPRALAYRDGLAIARDLLLLQGRETNALDDWHVPVFPLKGGAIVAAGVAAGPDVARILQAVEAKWIAEGFPDAGRVEAILQSMLDE